MITPIEVVYILVSGKSCTMPELVRRARRIGLTEAEARRSAQNLIELGELKLGPKFELSVPKPPT